MTSRSCSSGWASPTETGQSSAHSFSPDLRIVAKLPQDKWLLSSVLQKAIRRGHVEYTLASSAALARLDPSYLSRRLPVIGYEEVGVAIPELLLQTRQVAAALVSATHDETVKLAATIGGRLAEALKSRAAGDIISLVEESPHAVGQAEHLARRPLADMISTVLDPHLSLIQRAVALHFILGLNCRGVRPPSGTRQARRQALFEVSEAMHLPNDVRTSILQGGQTHNLNIVLPLAYELVRGSPDCIVAKQSFRTATSNGILLCAADQYTRVGQAAYRLAYRRSRELQELLRVHAPKANPVKCIGMLMFHVEGSLLKQEITSPASTALRMEVEEAEAIAVGVTTKVGAGELCSWLSCNNELIDDSRIESLRKAGYERM